METLQTARMRLVPATADMVRMEMHDRDGLGRTLAAAVPPGWPPETIADALPWFAGQLESDPALTGWLCWYGVVRGPEGDTLAASGGFMGAPEVGAVEIGYSVLPAFQRQGYATEMAAGLIRWALPRPGVERVVAEADIANTPSLLILRRLGFTETGPGREPGHRHFERVGGRV